MSWLGRILGKPEDQPNGSMRASLPTVKFDERLITPEILADIKATLSKVSIIPSSALEDIYEAATLSVSRGRDLAVLAKALGDLACVSKRDAANIALLINNRATAKIDQKRLEISGIERAKWLYSGAPCEVDPKHPTGQDELHRTANGKTFSVSTGLEIQGRHVWPGAEPGCRCSYKAIIPGFDGVIS